MSPAPQTCNPLPHLFVHTHQSRAVNYSSSRASVAAMPKVFLMSSGEKKPRCWVQARGGTEHFVTPGTHSKWIDVSDGSIEGFSTYMTGEVFALLKSHSILGKLLTSDTSSLQAFKQGVRASLKDPAGFLHHIFSTRTLALFNEMPTDHLSSYLSGQVIGTEIAHAIAKNPANAQYGILATPALGEHYMAAMKIAGLNVSYGELDVAVKGLRRIAITAGLLS